MTTAKGNENGEKAIGTLHMLHAFLYTSLLSLHENDASMPNFTFYGGRKLAPTNFLSLFKLEYGPLKNQP